MKFKEMILNENIVVEETKISSKTRNAGKKALQKLLKNPYFKEIPITEITDVLRKVGIVLLQEDNTEWSGMLLGANGNTLIRLGNLNYFIDDSNGTGQKFYSRYKNTALALQWHDMESTMKKTYEINGYIT